MADKMTTTAAKSALTAGEIKRKLAMKGFDRTFDKSLEDLKKANAKGKREQTPPPDKYKKGGLVKRKKYI